MACFLLGTLTLGLLGYLMLPKRYASSSVLTVQHLVQDAGQETVNLEEQFRGLQAQLLADNTLKKIVARVSPFSGKVARETAAKQVKHIKNNISMTLESELQEIHLGYIGSDPVKVMELVEALTERTDQLIRGTGQRGNSSDVNEQLAVARSLVEEKEGAMRTYLIENFEAMPEQLEENLSRMELLKKKLVEATVAYKKSGQEYLLRKKNLDQEVDQEKRTQIQLQLDQLAADVSSHKAVVESLSFDLEKLQELIGATKEHEENWARLSQGYEQSKAALDRLMEQPFDQDSPGQRELAHEETLVTSPASYPAQPFSPRLLYFALFSSLLGGISGSAFVVYSRYRHKTLQSPFDIERYLDIPVDCSIAYLPVAKEQKRTRLKILLSAGGILLYAFLLTSVILWLQAEGALVW